MASNRFQTLSFNQVDKLDAVISERRVIHSRNKTILPSSIEFPLRHFIVLLRDRINKYGIHIEEIRLNGGAASYILGDDVVPTFNDLDVIFKLTVANETDFEIIRVAVLETIQEYLPETDDSATETNVAGAYVDKMIKIWNEKDRWSLISLGLRPHNVELKFVCQMQREYQFSVDSFQIMLDSLLTFYSISSQAISEHFFPTIVAESVYGSFSEAFRHLQEKLIGTCSPENIRGGGLLRYCDLLVKGYRPVDEQVFVKNEQYMCTRFFIDFMDVPEQARQISGYLQNHFVPTEPRKYDYLKILQMVIERSAVCLMNQERQYALDVISRLAHYELRWREVSVTPFRQHVLIPLFFQVYFPTYISFPPPMGYYYPVGHHVPQSQGSISHGKGAVDGYSKPNSRADYQNGQRVNSSNHHNQQRWNGPRAHNSNSNQHYHHQKHSERHSNVVYYPQQPFVKCPCQRCLGQSPDSENGGNNNTMCCLPVWISPAHLYPPSSLVVITSSPITMSSPSGSPSLGSSGLGSRATPSPTTFLTTPISSAVPTPSLESYSSQDVLNGDAVNSCLILNDDDIENNSEDMSSRSSNASTEDNAKMMHLLNDDSGVETLSVATNS